MRKAIKMLLLFILVYDSWILSKNYRHLRLTGKFYIGLLSPERWQEYRNLRLNMLLESPSAFGGSYLEESQYSDNQWRDYLIEAASETRTILTFFLKDDIVVGMAGAKIGLTYKTKHKATLFSVYVSPNYRGLGIGIIMIEFILEKIKLHSIKKIEAIVGVDQISALNLYQRFNFLIEGRLKNFWLVDNNFVDVYALGLFL